MSKINDARTDVEFMVENILRFYSNANAQQRFEGERWYDDSRVYAAGLAEKFGVTTDVVACVIAAHSVNCRWAENKRRTELQLAGTPTGFKRYIAMAADAMANPSDPFPYIVGPKINPFARCVAGDLTAVATDRWAQRAAFDTVDDKLMSKLISRKGVRNDMILAYTKAAATVGIPPAVMQAIVWVVVRGAAD